MTERAIAYGRIDPFEAGLPSKPYPGLRPFQSEEWPIFFGREPMIHRIIDLVIENKMVVVHGDSGCGKSSLVRAGVLVQLEQGYAATGGRWRTTAMLPREDPLGNLAKALASVASGGDPDPSLSADLREILNGGRYAPETVAMLLREGGDDHICILVDQFEELFGYDRHGSHADAACFVEFLTSLAGDPPPGLYIILTMRSEFLGNCARYERFAETVNRTQYLLPRMGHPALMRAIREPAQLFDGKVSRELAERLIADAGGDPDQLPLIQHGLMRLRQRKVGQPNANSGNLVEGTGLGEAPGIYRQKPAPAWTLDLADYRASGGLAQLLSDHANEVMDEVAPDEQRQKIVQHLFRALTDINADGHAIRRPQTVEQLQAVTGAQPAILEAIMKGFRAEGVSFINPYGNAPLDPDQQVDISHEALIRWWQRIADPANGWLQREFRDGLVWKTLLVMAGKGETLSAAATADRNEWLKRLPSEVWAKRYGGDWSQVKALLERSNKAAEEREKERQRETEERVRRAEELRAEQSLRAEDAIASQKRQRWLTMAAFGTAVIAILAAVIAWQQSATAENERLRANAGSYWNQLKLWGDPIEPRDVATLWNLTREDDSVRVEFVRQLADSPDLLAQFGRKPQPIARAVGLTWPDQARQIITQSMADLASGQLDLKGMRAFGRVSYTRALVALAPWLDLATLESGTEEIADAITDLAATPQLTDQQLWALAEMVGAFAERFEWESIEPAHRRLREIIGSAEPSGSAGQAISRAIEVMAPFLDSEERSRAVQYLVPLLVGQNTDSRAAKAASRALVALLPELDRSQSDAALGGVPPAIAKIAVEQSSGDSSYLLTLLMQVPEALADEGDQAAVAAFERALLDELKLPNQPRQHAALAHATIPLLPRLPDGPTPINRQVADATALIPGSAALDLEQRLNPMQRSLLRERVRNEIAEELSHAASSPDAEQKRQQAEAVLERLYARWNEEPSPAAPNPYRLAAQVRLLAMLAPSLTPVSAARATEKLVEILRAPSLTSDSAARPTGTTHDHVTLAAIARALAEMAPNLSDTDRDKAIEAAMDALAMTGSTEEAIAWAIAIAALLSSDPRAATAQTVEALKYPTATGTPTDILLEGLARPWPEEFKKIAGKKLPDPEVRDWLRAHLPVDYKLTAAPNLPPGLQRPVADPD